MVFKKFKKKRKERFDYNKQKIESLSTHDRILLEFKFDRLERAKPKLTVFRAVQFYIVILLIAVLYIVLLLAIDTDKSRDIVDALLPTILSIHIVMVFMIIITFAGDIASLVYYHKQIKKFKIDNGLK